MKIKALFLAAAVLVCGSVFAQETNKDANGNRQYGPYLTKKFFQNWYVGIGAGANMGMNEFISSIQRGDVAESTQVGLGLNIDAYLGKNITPCFGVRLGYQGLTSSIAQKWGTLFSKFYLPGDADNNTVDAAKTPEGAFNFHYVHGDFMWNISNQFAGYKEKRIVDVIPYAHAGFLWGGNPIGYRETYSWGAGVGIQIPFRIGDYVHIVPDFRYTFFDECLMTGNHVRQDLQFHGIGGMLTATLGIQVGLGKQNFTRLSTTLAASAAALAAAEAAKSALQAEKDKLANALAAANADRDALAAENARLKEALANVPAPENLILNKKMVVFFDINKATLSNRELEHLDFYVQNVIAANKTLKFTIVGTADSKTGKAAYNQSLSQKRADNIYNLLTKKYGLDESRFEIKAIGGIAVNSDIELDRSVLIENE